MGVYQPPGFNPSRPEAGYVAPPPGIDAVTRPNVQFVRRDPRRFAELEVVDPVSPPAWYLDAQHYTDLGVKEIEDMRNEQQRREVSVQRREMDKALASPAKSWQPEQRIDIGAYIDRFFIKPPLLGN